MDLPPPKDLLPRPLRRALAPVVRFLWRSQSRYVLSWLFALGVTAGFAYNAWNGFNVADRADGNDGHTSIDFGGQWLMGRMLVEGHGLHLYDRDHQRIVLTNNYPVEDQDPKAKRNDADALLSWLMRRDNEPAARAVASLLVPLAAPDAPSAAALFAAGLPHWTAERLAAIPSKQVGGPLYPPINALFIYPLALIEPHAAYRIAQGLNLVLAFLCGLAVSRLTRGWLWCPIAAALVMGFPGFAGSCNLGQNSTLSLAMLLWGWVLIAGGRPGWGGAVWGLLSYKPVWAMVFFLGLALTQRWRACLAMLATGAALALITLPLVGLESWFDWLDIGKVAVHVYNFDQNWIFLSRDLLSIPRRWLLDFVEESAEVRAANKLAPVIGWAMLLTIAILTVALALWRRRQARVPAGPPAAFIFLGSWLCCFHFMYYDALLAAFPVFLLTAAPLRYYLRVALSGRMNQSSSDSSFREPTFTFRVSNRAIGVILVVVLILIQIAVDVVKIGTLRDPPFDTFFLILVWLGCGWVWLRTPSSRKDEGGRRKEQSENAFSDSSYILPPSSV
jgi:arabinofuranan 3-O-arabinosyltransferase